MGIRPKLLSVFIAVGVLPVVALNVVGYLKGMRAVEAELRSDVERDAQMIARGVERRLQERDEALVALAHSPTLRAYVRSEGKREVAATTSGASPVGLSREMARPPVGSFALSSAENSLPENVQAEVRALF